MYSSFELRQSRVGGIRWAWWVMIRGVLAKSEVDE